MTDTPHVGLPVAGYRPQSKWAVDTVNEHKKIEEQILQLMDKYKQDAEIDQRWLAIARTGLEQSFMALNRSIFKPERLK